MNFRFVILAVFLHFVLSVSTARSDDRADETLKIAIRTVESVELRLGSNPPSGLKLVPEPVLNWSNPTVGTVFGSVFLWTKNSRPRAIASFHRMYSPIQQAAVEFTSLTEEPVTAVDESGARIWDTAKAGITWAPIPAGNPLTAAETRARRLLQMRRLAGEFSVTLLDGRSANSVTQRQLRMLPKPIYRYPADMEDVSDGAIFAFVEGTDPEALLLLEAKPHDSRKGDRWHVAMARMNIFEIIAKHKKTKVWSAPRILNYVRPSEPFTSHILNDR